MKKLPRRNIMITCVGGTLIYDVFKALRTATDFSVRIVGCDADSNAHGRVLADRFYVLPHAGKNQDAFMEQVWRLTEEEKIDLILPLSEPESLVLSRHRNKLLERGTAVSVSKYETVALMTDKLTMMDKLSSKRIHVLPYRVVDDVSSFEKALRDLGYPERKVIFKPRKSAGARGVLLADQQQKEFRYFFENRLSGTGDRDALLATIKSAGLSLQDYLAMSYVGGSTYDVDCIAVNGKATDIVPRLRQWQDPFSPASTGNRVDMNPEIISYCSKLCSAFGVDGAGDFDVAIDDDGSPVVFDAGVRLSGSVGGAVVAGANMPAQLVRVMTGLPRQEFRIRDGCVIRPFQSFSEIPEKNQDDLL